MPHLLTAAVAGRDGLEPIAALADHTGQPIPPCLQDLDRRAVLHRRRCGPAGMKRLGLT